MKEEKLLPMYPNLKLDPKWKVSPPMATLLLLSHCTKVIIIVELMTVKVKYFLLLNGQSGTNFKVMFL